MPVVFSIRSDHALFGQRLDLLGRHPQQLAVHVVVVLTIAGRAPVEATPNVGWTFAHLDGYLRHRPAADLRARHLRQPVERRQLRVVVAAVLSRLADPRRHASLLQAEHRLIALQGLRPSSDHGIEGVLVR